MIDKNSKVLYNTFTNQFMAWLRGDLSLGNSEKVITRRDVYWTQLPVKDPTGRRSKSSHRQQTVYGDLANTELA